METVGIIANPAAGKDIRRLVAHGRFVPDNEKINILKRVLAGLKVTEIEKVVIMPDPAMLGSAAIDDLSNGPNVEILEMSIFGEERDSTKAATLMSEMGVGCLVTLGGDGTNRAVVKGANNIPLLPISTGTNNVFPSTIEGTVAGLAAGVVAKKLVDLNTVTKVTNVLKVESGTSISDIALVDIAVSKERFVGSRAIWDMDQIHELFLARTHPASIGLSSVGARIRPSTDLIGPGIHVRIGDGGFSVIAPVVPGSVIRVPIQNWSPMGIDKPFEIDLRPCTIALDGERTITVSPQENVTVTLSDKGPILVSVEAAIHQATLAGIFQEGLSKIPIGP